MSNLFNVQLLMFDGKWKDIIIELSEDGVIFDNNKSYIIEYQSPEAYITIKNLIVQFNSQVGNDAIKFKCQKDLKIFIDIYYVKNKSYERPLYYESGNLMYYGSIINNKYDNIKTNISYLYYDTDNNQLKCSGKFENGILKGHIICYSKCGYIKVFLRNNTSKNCTVYYKNKKYIIICENNKYHVREQNINENDDEEYYNNVKIIKEYTIYNDIIKLNYEDDYFCNNLMKILVN